MTEKIPNLSDYPFYDDLSLFDIADTLWRKKWLIIAISAVFVLASIVYLLTAERQYESKIQVEFALPRPDNLRNIAHDMKHLLEDEKTYQEWAQPNSVLKFTHIHRFENVGGFLYAIDEENVDVTFIKIEEDHFLLIRSGNPALILDVKNYADFLNAKLTNEYKRKTLADLEIVNTQLAKSSGDSGKLAQHGVELEKYLQELESGTQVVRIHRPTEPGLVFPKPRLTVAIAIILGGFFSCGFVLVYDGYKTHRQRKSTKA